MLTVGNVSEVDQGFLLVTEHNAEINTMQRSTSLTTWRSTTRWTRTFEGLRGARLFHLVSLTLQISLVDVCGCCLFWVVFVLCWFLSSGEIWFQSYTNSSRWPTMSRTCPAMQEKKKNTMQRSTQCRDPLRWDVLIIAEPLEYKWRVSNKRRFTPGTCRQIQP